jgi:nucleoside-diphosphate-sugar epimerase
MSNLSELSGPVFVTGADGWIGKRLIAALRGEGRASQIHALVLPGNRTRELLALGCNVIQGDVRDSTAVGEFLRGGRGGTVIHLAGVIHPSDHRTATFFQVNVKGTRHVLETAKAFGLRRVVAMSSNSPFGANTPEEPLFTENSRFRPYMGYGRSKCMMEQLLWEHIGCGGGPEVVIVRAPWFYGPNQPERQSRFFSLIRSGRFPIFGNGQNRRSMAYVDSLASGLLLAASTPAAAGQAYWIADEQPYTMNEIVDTVRTVLADDFGLPVSPRQMRVPGLVSDAARVADIALQCVGFYQQEIHVLSEMNLNISCSIRKARDELGYRPAVALREGMRRSVQWCLDEGMRI